jgi:hypothetical protein
VGILEDDKGVAPLRANLQKMDCGGLLDISWHHEEPAWLQEIWKKDRSAFPNTVRANPELVNEKMIAEVFGICREGLGLPYKVKGHNYAKDYFTSDAHMKEGWKFSECKDEALRDVFKFLTPLVNPMKLARITGKFAITVVECLFFDKKVSWGQVLAEVLAQQVKLMGPKNLKVCLSDPEPTPDTSGEWQEQETDPPSGNKTQTKEEPTGNPPPEKPEMENQAGSVEKVQEADQSQGPAHSTLGQLAGGQEAQGE